MKDKEIVIAVLAGLLTALLSLIIIILFISIYA